MHNRAILVVDGTDQCHEVAKRLLKEGCSVEFTHCGKLGLDKLNRRGVWYDALVIGPDVKNMEQQDLACSVRNMAERPNLVVVCLGKGIERVNGPRYRLVPNTFCDLREALVEIFAAQSAAP